MVESQAQVVRVDGDSVVLNPVSSSAGCSACAKSGCSGSVLAGLWPKRDRSFVVPNRLDLAVGDWVQVGIPEGQLVRASLLLYLLPLVGLLFGAGLIAQMFPASGELGTVLGGLLGMIIALAWIRGLTQRNRIRAAPVLLKRTNSHRVDLVASTGVAVHDDPSTRG